jgi:ketosteroid isomerase-like protein
MRTDVLRNIPAKYHVHSSALLNCAEPETWMKTLISPLRLALGLSLLCLFIARANGQEKIASLDEIKNQADLDKAITALDTKLFDAYNHCDLKTFESLLADDVEFYHDQGGVTLGRQKLTESVKNNICTGDTQRVLVPGTLKIYYVKGYGAIEMGVHRFLHPKTEATNGTGEASFVQLWQYKDGNWKLTRVMSYDHHSANPKG